MAKLWLHNNSKEYNLSNTKRTLFLKDLFASLQENCIAFCVIRGHEHIFKNKENDIDILMSPSDYKAMISIYMKLLKKYNGKLFTSNFSIKNYYIRSLFVNKEVDEIEGLYIHITAYITIKPSARHNTNKLSGKRIWVDNINTLTVEIDGTSIPIPDYKMEIMFLLSAYLNKQHLKYLKRIESLLTHSNLYSEISAKNNWIYLYKALQKNSRNINIPKLHDMCNELTLDINTQKKFFFRKEYTTLIKLNATHVLRYKGKLIFFSGPDGSGKTTANNSLTTLLKSKLKTNIYNSKHLYPVTNKYSKQGIKLQAKIRNIDPTDSDAIERDRGHTTKWRMRRLFGLLFILAQIYPGYISARYRNLKGQTVIIDTSFFDAFIKGHRPAFPLLQKLAIPLIPCNDKWFLMKATPAEIVSRKPELTLDELEFYYNSIEKISKLSVCSPIEVASNKGELHALQIMIDNISK